MSLTILQYITPSRLGGAEHYFLRLVTHLAQSGHRVIVVTKRDTPLRPEVEKLIPLGVQVHPWVTHGKIDPPTLAKLCALVRQEKVDLINTHLTTASWQGALTGKITGVPTVAVVHATDRKTWFQHADRLVAVSQGVRDALLAQGVPDAKIKVLYHGIDLKSCGTAYATADAKKRLGLSPDARTVGVAASLISRKGHRFLLEALHKIQQETGPIHAIFAGEGPLETTLREQSQALGMEDRVHFLGFRRDVLDVLSAMDIFVLPSSKEGLSIAVMEAMALSKPVVVTNIAGLPEVVRNGETGLLVPPGDVVALADALLRLVKDPALGQRLGVQGRTFLQTNFDQKRCLDEMQDYFQEVVAQWAGSTVLAPLQSSASVSMPDATTPIAETAPLSISGAFSPSLLETAAINRPPAEPIAPQRRLTMLQYITPSRIGGAERYFLRLITHLARSGHRIIVVTKRDTPLRPEVEKLLPLGIELNAWVTHGKVDPATLAKLAALVREKQVDLINTHLTTASWLGSMAGRLTGVPSVARVPATDRARFFQFADHLIAVSNGVRDHLVAQGVSPEKIAVFYNGIDLKTNRAPFSTAEAKKRLGLSPDARTVGVAASLISRKGHRFLLEALHKIQQETGPVHLLLAGEGNQDEPLREQAKSLGMEDRVHFLGFRRDILEIETAMDIFVLPSLKEGLSNAVMEAMALERPVIATNIAGLPEVVRDGETGLLVPPGDVEALSQALLRLLGDDELAARIGRQGRQLLEAEFDQTHCLDAVEKFLRQVALQHEVKRASSRFESGVR